MVRTEQSSQCGDMGQAVRVTCAGRTDTGVVRPGNEDAFLMLPEAGVFIVADGMGGHAAGEVASEMAVTIIGSALKRVVAKPWAEITRPPG